MELVAHRAANLSSTIETAAAVTNVLELDVHPFRGRLEVRHAKIMWPFASLWERWEFLPADTPRPELAAILAAVPDGVHLWLDLKGFTSRFSRRVLTEIGDRRPVTASTRSWWILRPLRSADGVRTLRSVGSRWQSWAVRRVRSWGERDGVVIHERYLTAESIDRLHRLTPTIFAWAVEDLPRALELLEWGVSGLVIDDLALIAEVDHHLRGR